MLRTVLYTLLLCFAGAVPAAGVSDAEIVLGTHLDLSGPTAAGMPQIRNGMQMRIDEANESGGVHGRKLRLIVEDNALQPAQAVRAVQKLTRKDEVFAIINAFGSGANAASVKGIVESGTVLFAPWGASAIIQKVGGASPLVYTTVANYDHTTEVGLGWAIRTWGVKRVGVIYQGDQFGELLRAGMKRAMDAAGLQPVAEASYKPGDVDFSSQVARMRQADAELVVIATVVRETIGVMAEVKKLGWNVRVLTAQPGRTQIVARLGKDAVEGLHGIASWPIPAPDASPAVEKFVASFKKRFNADPDENAMLAYSYTDWFVKGLQAAGRNLSAESFGRAMAALPHEDFMTFQRSSFRANHMEPQVVRVERITGGRWTPLSPLIGN
jgi:ABC-type branched-subunit amino acid transport system substrate-binding protein